MMTRRFRAGLILSLAVTAALGVRLLAHELTVRGTVGAIERARIQVKPIADKPGEKPAGKPEWYPIDAKTAIKRGDKTLTFDDAKIKVDERVVVIVDHPDKGPMKTKEIRLAAQ
jgi:hypothetical protein